MLIIKSHSTVENFLQKTGVKTRGLRGEFSRILQVAARKSSEWILGRVEETQRHFFDSKSRHIHSKVCFNRAHRKWGEVQGQTFTSCKRQEVKWHFSQSGLSLNITHLSAIWQSDISDSSQSFRKQFHWHRVHLGSHTLREGGKERYGLGLT